jgi:hypothetical protein
MRSPVDPFAVRPSVKGLLLLVLVAACSNETETNTTPGFRVTLDTQVELAGAPTFENAFGWEISLSKIAVSTGPLYYFSGAPIESVARSLEQRPALRAPSSPWDWGLGAWAPRPAYAHPGHYDPGDAKGEMLEPASFDLAKGPFSLPSGDGTSGMYRSARFAWGSPPQGALAAELGSRVLVLEGTASRASGDTTVSKVFRLAASASDVLDAADEPVLEGCTFDEVDVQGDGLVTIEVDPRVWLDQADFSDVPQSAGDDPVDVPADLEAARAFARGIKKSTAFTFRFTAR